MRVIPGETDCMYVVENRKLFRWMRNARAHLTFAGCAATMVEALRGVWANAGR
jgi:hypothetical protein